MNASLRVLSAGPLVSFQDAGRPGHMRFGVPASGPMDRLAHAAANRALGNDAEATAIEVSMGGLVLAIDSGPLSVAVAGGGFRVRTDGETLEPWGVFTLRQGQRLEVSAGAWGSWAYVAFAGAVTAAEWLGQTATHSVSEFGGGMIAAGQAIEVAAPRVASERVGAIPAPAFARPDAPVRVVLGPQQHHFSDESCDEFLAAEHRLTSAYDRMGVRLSGPSLVPFGALSIPSEPIVRGSVQVAGDGVATILLADHQTTGGYPKIATIISADLDRVTQLRSGDPIRFTAVAADAATAITREHATDRANYLEATSRPGRTLSQRLMLENLIGGTFDPAD